MLKLIQALFATTIYLFISCGPLTLLSFLWVKVSYMEISMLSVFLSFCLLIATYIFIRWGVVVVKKTNFPLWLNKLTDEQKSYIESFLEFKKEEAKRFGIESANEIYQYQYYMVKRIFGSPLVWRR